MGPHLRESCVSVTAMDLNPMYKVQANLALYRASIDFGVFEEHGLTWHHL